MLTISKDRLTDPEIIIVTCELDWKLLEDKYFFDIIKTDEEIDSFVTNDLTTKWYVL